jgi:hypothetical protein
MVEIGRVGVATGNAPIEQKISAYPSGKPTFMSTRPSTTLADLLTLLLPAYPDLAVRTPPRA